MSPIASFGLVMAQKTNEEGRMEEIVIQFAFTVSLFPEMKFCFS